MDKEDGYPKVIHVKEARRRSCSSDENFIFQSNPLLATNRKPVRVASFLPHTQLICDGGSSSLILLFVMHDNCSWIRTLIREIGKHRDMLDRSEDGNVFDFLLAISCPFNFFFRNWFESLAIYLNSSQRTRIVHDNKVGLVSVDGLGQDSDSDSHAHW